MNRSCPRCGARLDGTAAECGSCGMPTVFMGPEEGLVAGGGAPVEAEVLESLDEAERTRFGPAPQARHVGCTLGPGCGCIGLPLAVLAGVVVSSLVALLWVLSLGRVPVSLVRLAQRLRRRPPGA